MSTNTPKRTLARMLPHSDEAEQSVLGCVLLDRDAAVYILGALKPEDFYSEQNANVFSAMSNIFMRTVPVDFVTLSDELESLNMTEKVGGMTYISSLSLIVPSAANYKHYCEIVKKHSVLRRLISASQKITDAAFDTSIVDTGLNDSDVLGFAEKQIFDIGESISQSELKHMSVAANNVFSRLELIHRDKTVLKGIPTGFTDLDRLTNGFQRSDLILLAARPSVGKTAFGMNVIYNIATCNAKKTESGNPYKFKCAVFSLEMSAEQIYQRMLCSAAGVNMKKAVSGELGKEDWQQIWAARKGTDAAEIYIDDSSLVTPVEILSKCRRLKREKGLDVVMIDYLQLMYSGTKSDNRQGEIAEITRRLKIAAKELDVPILLLSQLSREVEKRQGNKPQLSDLRESGAIEQDADIVMFLHRKYDNTDESLSPEQRSEIDLVVSKHRNGELKTIPLYWHGETVTFRNYVRADNEPQ